MIPWRYAETFIAIKKDGKISFENWDDIVWTSAEGISEGLNRNIQEIIDWINMTHKDNPYLEFITLDEFWERVSKCK